jgi:hypothetical protein
MLVSYWDAGYVTLDVNDPANPKYIGDTSFDGPDPLTGWDPPEGNAHQAEFSHDNRYILAADEDFDTHRFITRINGESMEFDVGIPVTPPPNVQPRFDLLPTPEDPIEGDTRFIGEGCVAAAVPAPQGAETIAVAERGTCDFDVKAANASAAGYDAILILNNVLGPAPRCDAVNLNMIFDDPNADIPALLVPRSIGFRIIDAYDPATYRCVPNDPTSTPSPAPNRAGVEVFFGFEFDGWGYPHLYERSAGKMRQVDAFAIEEGLDERYATGFGDLTVHEFATDPTANVAYSSYYAGGMRVFTFGEGGLTQTGKFIDEGGNNFWGVEQFTSGGVRYFAGSDRDFGLYILRYTGPGAPQLGTAPPGTARPGTAPPGTAQPGAGRCVNLRTGTAASERLTGTRFGDTIVGYAGDDVIDGLGGRDCISGKGGDDRLDGGTGGDTVDGQTGTDRITGGNARDTVRGGAGADRVSGGRGADVVQGDAGSDRLRGGSRRDVVTGGAGNDDIDGGRGRDSIEADAGADRISARDGAADSIDCGRGRDTVVTRDKVDRLTSCEEEGRRAR